MFPNRKNDTVLVLKKWIFCPGLCTEWRTFSRRHFQMHFLEWKFCISNKISLKFVIKGPIDNDKHWFRWWLNQWWPSLVVYMRHSPSMSLVETIEVGKVFAIHKSDISGYYIANAYTCSISGCVPTTKNVKHWKVLWPRGLISGIDLEIASNQQC